MKIVKLDEAQSYEKRVANKVLKDFVSNKYGIKLHKGATVHHLKSSSDIAFAGVMNNGTKATPVEVRQALKYVFIIDAGTANNNTAFNDVIHRMLHLTNNNVSDLMNLFDMIQQASIYYFDGNTIVKSTLKQMSEDPTFNLSATDFDNAEKD